MKLLFVDTETTGLGKEDRLIQVAFKTDLDSSKNEPYSFLFRPPFPIPFEAMMTHHITNEMVAGQELFADSLLKKDFIDYSREYIFVAHNAPFDLEMFKREGIEFPLFIDTKRIALHLIDAPMHKLQYLRYALALNVEGQAHTAGGDVKVLVALFEYLYRVIEQNLRTSDRKSILDRMMTLSVTPALLKKLYFGQYYGKAFDEVLEHDRQYLSWLYNKEMNKIESERNADLIFTLQQYLKNN